MSFLTSHGKNLVTPISFGNSLFQVEDPIDFHTII